MQFRRDGRVHAAPGPRAGPHEHDRVPHEPPASARSVAILCWGKPRVSPLEIIH